MRASGEGTDSVELHGLAFEALAQTATFFAHGDCWGERSEVEAREDGACGRVGKEGEVWAGCKGECTQRANVS